MFQERPPSDPSLRWRGIVLVGLVAPSLGGSTSPGGLALLCVAMGTLFLVAPAQRLPSKGWLLLAAALMLAGLTAFLPASWFALPPWRSALQEAGIPLPATLSPQPWKSAESLLTLSYGLLWFLYVFSEPWSEKDRRQALRFHVVGISLLTALAILAHLAKISIPLWPNDVFGFFPNRNQTANVIGLAGIMVFALVWQNTIRRRRGSRKLFASLPAVSPLPTGDSTPRHTTPTSERFSLRRLSLKDSRWKWTWFFTLPILLAALILDSSRAGIALFFFGGAGAILCAIAFSSSRKNASLGLASILFLLSGFFLFGGNTLQRIRNTTDPVGELRGALQADCLDLAAISPWTGIGLANFQAVFAMHRSRSGGIADAIHPESDWLWTAAELGWPAAFLLLAAFGFWIWKSLPFKHGSDRFLRATTLLAGVAFAIHGFFDVSGHRPGSLWPAILLLSLSIHPSHRSPVSSRATALSRACGVALLITGAIVLLESTNLCRSNASSPDQTPLPTALPSQRLERIHAQVKAAAAADDYDAMLALTQAGLRLAPLDATLHFQNAAARVLLGPDSTQAENTFAIVQLLQPRWVQSCWQEGQIWIVVDEPERAFTAWQKALNRTPSTSACAELYRRILVATGPRAALRSALRELADQNSELLLCFLETSPEDEIHLELEQLLARDPSLRGLTPSLRSRLFQLWHARGPRDQLLRLLKQDSTLLADGWRWVAEESASNRNFEAAYQLVRKFGGRPSIPSLKSSSAVSELERKFVYQPSDRVVGLMLAQAQQRAGSQSDAIRTVRQLRRLPDPPAYLAQMEAELHAQLNQWEAAWNCWKNPSPASPRQP